MALKSRNRQEARRSRHGRVRRKVKGNAKRPRMCVFRSNAQIYCQIINDEEGKTLVSASSIEKDIKEEKGKKSEISAVVGKRVAERALEKNIKEVVFDRGGYKYHGRVKALAEAAREAGLKF